MTLQLGTLYILSAASGTGKTSLVSALTKRLPEIQISVSYTTRPPRFGDRDGVDYNFVSQTRFDSMLAQDDFLEHANIFGYGYATSKKYVQNALDKGVDVILEIDWQGAQQVRKKICNAIGIFIIPPSYQELKTRITNRNQDSQDVIGKRLQSASGEIGHYNEYDYIIINDDFHQALADLESVIRANRCRCKLQSHRHKELLDTLSKANLA